MNRPLKILLTSTNPHDEEQFPVGAALEKLGHDVMVCDVQYKLFGSRLLFRLGRRLFLKTSPYLWNHFVLRTSSSASQKKVIQAARSFRPDVFLAVKAKEVDTGTVLQLRKMGITTANWYMEGLWHQSVFILSPIYDYFFVMDEYTVSVLRDKGIKSAYYLPHGTRVSETEFNSRKNPNRIYEVSFIGTPNELRERVLNSISNFNLNIWGPKVWEETELKKFYRGSVFGPELDQIYRQSKIVINSHNPTEKASGTNLRDFEAPGNGALLVSDYNNAVADIFKENEEAVFYRNVGELSAKVSYYLENEDKLSDIAKAGQMLVFRKHTIEDRVKNMLDIMKNSIKINEHANQR